ncbi:hypothetical protein TWF694_000964 [Orbilia ellipsospora]|uniref:LYR motif-containing protein 5A n=1 Tax=Orbilia ellipsospora TaxID=2528407 RepID=A0AAV9XQ82_9PEZI
MSTLRYKVLNTYKELLFLGKSYPLGYTYFRTRCHAAFSKAAGITDEAEIEKKLALAEYVKKEIEMLYYLKKYRAIKKRYE